MRSKYLNGLKFKKYFNQCKYFSKLQIPVKFDHKSIPDLVILENSNFCIILLMNMEQVKDKFTIKLTLYKMCEMSVFELVFVCAMKESH